MTDHRGSDPGSVGGEVRVAWVVNGGVLFDHFEKDFLAELVHEGESSVLLGQVDLESVVLLHHEVAYADAPLLPFELVADVPRHPLGEAHDRLVLPGRDQPTQVCCCSRHLGIPGQRDPGGDLVARDEPPLPSERDEEERGDSEAIAEPRTRRFHVVPHR